MLVEHHTEGNENRRCPEQKGENKLPLPGSIPFHVNDFFPVT
jgi:hypothetical protein